MSAVTVIDLTLSDTEEEQEVDTNLNTATELDECKCEFHPPISIAGNILNCIQFRILKSPAAWIDDEIINSYFNLLINTDPSNYFAFSSHFYDILLKFGEESALKRWTRHLKSFLLQINLNDCKKEPPLVLIPINSGASHWVLVIWNIHAATLEYYDSLMCKRSGNKILKRLKSFFNMLISQINDKEEEKISSNETEKEDKLDGLEDLSKSFLNLNIGKESFNVKEIKNVSIPSGQLQQSDGSSCGIFTCCSARAAVTSSKLELKQISSFKAELISLFINTRRKHE